MFTGVSNYLFFCQIRWIIAVDGSEKPYFTEEDAPEEYRAYFRHFERGEFYECHEVLESLWLRDKNRFYQGLIQLAVAFYHLQRGNVEGGRKLLTAAEEKLREYPVGFKGLDTQAVADWCQECRDALPPDRRTGPPVTPSMCSLIP